MNQPAAHLSLALLAMAFGGSASSSAREASAPSFHVAGVVLAEGTNVPVPRCHLSIRPEGQRNERRRSSRGSDALVTETDTQGRFAFDLPAEGSWQLSASANGFRTQFYNEHEGYSSAVVVHAATPVPSLLFHLEPDSSISGYVHDEAAEPVRNASVIVQAADPIPASIARRQRATTDDRGHYEVTGIGPGTYKVSVQATPWYTAGTGGRSAGGGSQLRFGDPVFDVVYPVTWYPGVLDAEAAGVVALHGGQTEHLDFTLTPIPAAHLRVATESSGNTPSVTVPTVERV